MNIAKLQSQLQSVPDQSLIGYVQQPNGQVPAYLALAEISRRKQMRTGGASQPAPTQTVAEQEVASADPGIASLPVDPNMYTEQTMAQGGIVSFQQGGILPRNALTPLSYEDYARLVPSEKQNYVNQFGAPPTREITPTPLESMGVVRNPALRRAMMEGAPLTPEVQAPVIAPGTPFDPTRSAPAPRAMPAPQLEQSQLVQPMTPAPVSPVTPTAGGQGLRSIAPSEPRFTPIETDTAAFDALMPQQQGLGEYRQEYLDALGTDPNRAKMQERIAAMEGRAAKEEGQAPWMALAEAGLGMAAGNSPFALQNIATGGMQGVKSLQAAKERAAEAEEKRFALESKLAEAQRAEELAALNYGTDSKRFAEQSKQTIGLQKQADVARAKEFNAKGKFEDKALSAQLAMEDKKIQANMKNIERQIAATANSDERAALRQASTNAKTMLDAATKQINNIRVEMTKSFDEATKQELAQQLEDAKAEYNDASAQLKALASTPTSAGDALVNKYRSK